MRSVLLVVLPSDLGAPQLDASKKTHRTYLAFPYGALTIASYLRRYAAGLDRAEILDLNLPSSVSPDRQLDKKLHEMHPEVVGFSMSYDVSYLWLKNMSRAVKEFDPSTRVVAGGPAVTTAHQEILLGCPDLDACCYSEGEVALRGLVEATDLDEALSHDPWVTRIRKSAKPVYDDLDRIVDVDYGLVDVGAYSMKEAFSPFTRFSESSRQFFIVTSRGCPFKCVFCAEPSFHGANMRYVSVGKVVDHVAMLKDKYGLRF